MTSTALARPDSTVAAIPSLLDDAERALAIVSEQESAEDLWRKLSAIDQAARLAKVHGEIQLRVGKLRLRAERRWGELLGPAEVGRPENVAVSNVSQRDRSARHKAREVAAVPEPVFEQYIEKARDPETLRRARLLRVAREKEAEELRAEPAEPLLDEDLTILHGDFSEVLYDFDLAGGIVITDPPYPREHLHLYTELAEFSLRAHVASVVLMVGQSILPDVLSRFTEVVLPPVDEYIGERSWEYRWCGAYLTPGPATRVWGAKVGTSWKPILIFDEGEREFVTRDVFSSSGDDKRFHHWGQNEEGIAQLVETFTNPGDLVIDPFLGGGTTAVVCRDLGRNFIGCDIDAAVVAGAKARLAA